MPMKKILQFIKSKLASFHQKNERKLKIFGPLLNNSYLWETTRKSITRATFIGVFIAFLPIPFHTIIVILVAIMIRANVPLALTLIWIVNPITLAPIFYFCYKLGIFILNTQYEPMTFEMSWTWFITKFSHIWHPLLVGTLITGLVLSTLAYYTIHIGWIFYQRRQLNKYTNEYDPS
jgi:uncharacterized protein (DUF2062 family)